MILCSKFKNGLCKIVTKSQIVTKYNVTKSRLHCTYTENRTGIFARVKPERFKKFYTEPFQRKLCTLPRNLPEKNTPTL